jgi:hypothetical protein
VACGSGGFVALLELLDCGVSLCPARHAVEDACVDSGFGSDFAIDDASESEPPFLPEAKSDGAAPLVCAGGGLATVEDVVTDVLALAVADSADWLLVADAAFAFGVAPLAITIVDCAWFSSEVAGEVSAFAVMELPSDKADTPLPWSFPSLTVAVEGNATSDTWPPAGCLSILGGSVIWVGGFNVVPETVDVVDEVVEVAAALGSFAPEAAGETLEAAVGSIICAAVEVKVMGEGFAPSLVAGMVLKPSAVKPSALLTVSAGGNTIAETCFPAGWASLPTWLVAGGRAADGPAWASEAATDGAAAFDTWDEDSTEGKFEIDVDDCDEDVEGVGLDGCDEGWVSVEVDSSVFVACAVFGTCGPTTPPASPGFWVDCTAVLGFGGGNVGWGGISACFCGIPPGWTGAASVDWLEDWVELITEEIVDDVDGSCPPPLDSGDEVIGVGPLAAEDDGCEGSFSGGGGGFEDDAERAEDACASGCEFVAGAAPSVLKTVDGPTGSLSPAPAPCPFALPTPPPCWPPSVEFEDLEAILISMY